MPQYFVRQAGENDAEELSKLVNSAYRGDSSRLGWTTEADLLGGQRTDPADIRGHIKSPGHKILALSESENGPILACVLLEFFDREQGKGCYLGMLTVKPNIQSKGIGRYLLESSEEDARLWGAEFVVLGVIQVRESLIAWYERRGYKKSGLTKPFPYGNLQFGAPKREDLYFVFFEKRLNP